MKKSEKAPTVQQILDKFDAYKAHYGTLHQQQKDIDDYYELIFDAGVPSKYPTRMPPTARDWVDAGVRNFTLDNPKSRVFPRAPTEVAHRQVELLELLYNFWLKKDIHKIKRGAKKLLKRGEVFIKVNMDDTFFGNEHPDKLFHFPLSLDFPDPMNVFPSPAHNGLVPVDVIESFNITVAEAQDLCERNNWKWTTTKKPNAFVAWFSFVSAKWRYFSLDKRSVLTPEVQPNIFGFCNYVHIDAGEGDDNYEGKPEYLYRSLIWSKKDMLKMEVRILSQLDAVNARYAWVRWKVRGESEAVKKLYPTGGPSTDPDEFIYEIPDRVEVDMVKGETPPSGLFNEYAMIKAQASAPEVLSGIRPAGVYSGQHQETLMATAKPIYKAAIKNFEEALGVSMGMGTRILEQVYASPVGIKNFSSDGAKQYQQITPKDIGGQYDCEVQLLAEPPEATDMRKGLGKALRQAGSISHYLELRDYQDMSEKEAMDAIAQMIAEAALLEPALRGGIIKDAMARLGMHKELEILEQAEREAKVKSIPPTQVGEGISKEGIKTQGRVGPGLEGIVTPGEQEVTRE